MRKKIQTTQRQTDGKVRHGEILLIALCFAVYFFYDNFDRLKLFSFNFKKTPEHFQNVEIEAKGAYVFDATNKKEIWGKNENVPLPFASLTKIMTAVCAVEILGANEIMNVSNLAINESEKVSLEWKVSDLASFMLTTSSNETAIFFQEKVKEKGFNIVNCMNNKTQSYGLFDTKFFNTTGLDMEGIPGAYGTSRDAANLLFHAMKNHKPIFENTRYPSYNLDAKSQYFTVQNTNDVAAYIPGMMASKTGLTEMAGGNLVIAVDVDLGRIVIISILGSSKEGRFIDSMRIFDELLIQDK